ncbi:hypothetical protein JYK00_06665 [Thermosipho ferrireducens]|uniref:Uncharacterized protein n=1 Tax=Thermosipho ferrireducens TaxID=2571116 RepID=A0ABX7S6F8_9BACT|nr:hypothetical protein [Thermosipho ferrireducens]QTA37416.1 hypothetical protein JYK00_06665 [Thermosipho ferrireducens]
MNMLISKEILNMFYQTKVHFTNVISPEKNRRNFSLKGNKFSKKLKIEMILKNEQKINSENNAELQFLKLILEMFFNIKDENSQRLFNKPGNSKTYNSFALIEAKFLKTRSSFTLSKPGIIREKLSQQILNFNLEIVLKNKRGKDFSLFYNLFVTRTIYSRFKIEKYTENTMKFKIPEDILKNLKLFNFNNLKHKHSIYTKKDILLLDSLEMFFKLIKNLEPIYQYPKVNLKEVSPTAYNLLSKKSTVIFVLNIDYNVN